MKIHQGLHNSFNIPKPIVTAGTFDGVHVGHRKIIERLQTLAVEKNGETVVISFEPHPRLVLFPDDNDLRLLSTMAEKEHLLEQAGIDHLIVLPFTKEFSRISSNEWILMLVENLMPDTLVIGYDHHFGRNREGSIGQLKQSARELEFNLVEIPPQDVDNIRVSSTKIRQALLKGDVKLANGYLEHAYSFTGIVVAGDKRGREIGYPTANMRIEDKNKLIPADGVYAVNASFGANSFEKGGAPDNKIYKGMLNIGFRPTVDGKKHTIEVHIFELEQDLYGKYITIQLMSRIRNEIKFKNVDALKMQLDKDAKSAIAELKEV